MSGSSVLLVTIKINSQLVFIFILGEVVFSQRKKGILNQKEIQGTKYFSVLGP